MRHVIRFSSSLLFLYIIVLCMPFSYADYDSQAPIIDISSIEISRENVTLDDEISISMVISDNVAVTNANVEFWSQGAGKVINTISLEKNMKSGRWGCIFKVSEDTPNGMLQISKINAFDANDNWGYINQFIDVATVYGVKDSQPPQIDNASIEVSCDTATINDEIDIFITITDNNAVTSANIDLWNGNAGRIVDSLPLTKDEITNKWKCTYRVTENTPNGLLQISKINAFDEDDNWGYSFPYADIATIYGAKDSQAPNIDISSIQVSHETATIGDKIVISLIIKDNNAVTSAEMFFWNGNVGRVIETQLLQKEKNTDRWSCTFTVTENTPDGILQISRINAFDAEANWGYSIPFLSIVNISHTFDFLSANGIKIPENVTSIEADAFRDCNFSICIIPNGCRSIEDHAFAENENLKRIWIPESVSSISENAFENCSNLIIYGKQGSFAAQFCQEQHILFIDNE